MGIKLGLVLAGAALVVAAMLVTLRSDGMTTGGALGPTDGHDLPAAELDRVVVGRQAPDFSLRALGGDVVALSDYRERKNVVLVFYRGHW